MKVCSKHWQMMRDAIDDNGLTGLVSDDGEEALRKVTDDMDAQQRGEPFDPKKNFDPLISLNWAFTNSAVEQGGMYMLFIDHEQNPHNDGHFCPVCEFKKHADDFDEKKSIDEVASEIRVWCVQEKLIGRAN